jgi:hypothetical protein
MAFVLRRCRHMAVACPGYDSRRVGWLSDFLYRKEIAPMALRLRCEKGPAAPPWASDGADFFVAGTRRPA